MLAGVVEDIRLLVVSASCHYFINRRVNLVIPSISSPEMKIWKNMNGIAYFLERELVHSGIHLVSPKAQLIAYNLYPSVCN
jgi:hypothetical protein